MQVAIAGGHGQIAIELTKILTGRGDQVRGLIRNADHEAEVRGAGAEPVICDLEESSEEELAEALSGVDAVVFAAGAGPDSDSERKRSVDLGGAVKLIEAAKASRVKRYLMISSMGADADHEGDEDFDAYLRAKGEADAQLRDSGLDYVIVRPGALTDDDSTGKVELAGSTGRGEIPRRDVAGVLAELLIREEGTGRTLELIAGETEVRAAIATLSDD